ncbi:MAG: rhodanese-related sulfurtransferase [Oceanipulchritudo sp.]
MVYRVSSFYRFVPLEDPSRLRELLLQAGETFSISGTILLAPEGINATIAASASELDAFMAVLRAQAPFEDLEEKRSHASEPPFMRFKVRLKKEIVTLGEPTVNPLKSVGEYIDPAHWNALLEDPRLFLIDARNEYEVRIGRFKGAVDPETASFRDFPAWARENLPDDRHQPIAMYCTGGIRCEKASSLVRQMGYEQVYHLKGGILKYLETIPPGQSLWQGSCFVFDGRVGLEHGLRESDYALCHGCRHPLSADDRLDPRYEAGVACPHCLDRLTEDRKARLRERHRQVLLARQEGRHHLGSGSPDRSSATHEPNAAR